MKQRLQWFSGVIVALLLLSKSAEAQDPFSGGEGTQEEPYQVENVQQLQAIQNYSDSYFEQITNIDASETEDWNEGKGFEPIEDFDGSYAGAGFTIEGLYINRPEEHEVGLFSRVTGNGNLSYINLLDADVTGERYVGSLVGRNYGGEIFRIITSGRVHATDGYAGGLAGRNFSQGGLIHETYSEANVSSKHIVAGGLVGTNQFHSEIRNSYAIGTVTARNDAGGLVGFNEDDGAIYTSYAAGFVYAEYFSHTGGFVGNNLGEVQNSYWDTESTGRSDGIGNGNMEGVEGLDLGEMTQSSS